MVVSAGVEGKWLIFSLAGGNIKPGYYHLTTLDIESLEQAGCEPGTFTMINGIMSDPQVRRAGGGGVGRIEFSESPRPAPTSAVCPLCVCVCVWQGIELTFCGSSETVRGVVSLAFYSRLLG